LNLPGSPKTHLWVGLVLSLVGVLVGGYAYTGDRIYHIEFLPVALLGLALLVGGSALAGYGQANRPRLGGRRDEDEQPGLLARARASIQGLIRRGDEDEAEGEDPDEDEPPDTEAEPTDGGEAASA
jgi:hypothetical protein